MQNNTETLAQFTNRKMEAAKATAVAARLTIGAVPETNLVGYEMIQTLIGVDAVYAEWAVVDMVAKRSSDLGEPDAVGHVHVCGYVQDRILAFSLSTSSGDVVRTVDNARLGALHAVLRTLRTFSPA